MGKIDKAIKRAIKKTNAEAVKEGSTLRVSEATCPNCGCADIDLKRPPWKGFECWDCGTVYQLPGMEDFESWL